MTARTAMPRSPSSSLMRIRVEFLLRWWRCADAIGVGRVQARLAAPVEAAEKCSPTGATPEAAQRGGGIRMNRTVGAGEKVLVAVGGRHAVHPRFQELFAPGFAVADGVVHGESAGDEAHAFGADGGERNVGVHGGEVERVLIDGEEDLVAAAFLELIGRDAVGIGETDSGPPAIEKGAMCDVESDEAAVEVALLLAERLAPSGFAGHAHPLAADGMTRRHGAHNLLLAETDAVVDPHLVKAPGAADGDVGIEVPEMAGGDTVV